MIIFKNINIVNFRNIRHNKLRELKDLNILIGPNNCGKTNLLELISSLSGMIYGEEPYTCKECQEFRTVTPEIGGLSLPLKTEDFYLNNPNNEMIVELSIDEKQIKSLVPGALQKQRAKIKIGQNNTPCKNIKEDITMVNEASHTRLHAKHLSPFIHRDIIEEISNSILYCPETRLQSYKEKKLEQYLEDRKLSTPQKKSWINFLQNVVDPRIDDEKYEKLIRKLDDADFETEIAKQGSGVRSLVCLAVDVLFSHNKRIVLIDEPELGPNPSVKQEFLKFLLDQSQEKQIFIATQDPTFVNPLLWKNSNIAVYFHSVLDDDFRKIDLMQNQEDPNVFAGYLPHTISLKDIHIYLEGTSDVYIFQIWLENYLKREFPENWFKLINKVGIYHLCGSFWTHLLYTIPKNPYKCIVILDGDKRENAEEICQKYNQAKVNTAKFVFCKDIENLRKFFGKEENHPIYCLKKNCVEKYLVQQFNCTNPPEDYRKTKDGPLTAEKSDIPEEIKKIFDLILLGEIEISEKSQF
nr:AAA family ATPase [Candidatus Freyarchaeota archaeon]